MANQNARATKKIVASKEVVAQLRGIQFVAEAPVYEAGEILVTVPEGLYTVSSRVVPASGGSKAWTAHEVIFSIGNEEFRVRYRSGEVPDETVDCVVTTFLANRDFTTTTGKVIKKGDLKIFAVNA